VRRAKISYAGRALWADLLDDDVLRLADGTLLPAEAAVWLPPVEPNATVFALGLNYADHIGELGFKPPETPLVFLKGSSAFVGHGGVSPLPVGARQMHPECELVAVIGRPARRVSRSNALDYVGGYTVANDYAIREYLENYYRPNLKVKSRAATTGLGPWIVDARDIGDPQDLTLSTRVNGQEVQQGSTRDMVFDVATMVEYLSEFMTLMPGDMILTGTPQGVHFVSGGDEVVCEVEKVGRLVNLVEVGG
jgi:5-oxopent-3-ene-1,2,5-tricarboxylate decarboxylase/2-hydroxyhepta-2,4-diene-1,7-dioate isomerase